MKKTQKDVYKGTIFLMQNNSSRILGVVKQHLIFSLLKREWNVASSITYHQWSTISRVCVYVHMHLCVNARSHMRVHTYDVVFVLSSQMSIPSLSSVCKWANGQKGSLVCWDHTDGKWWALNSDTGAPICHQSTSVQATRLGVAILWSTGRMSTLQVSQPAFLAL